MSAREQRERSECRRNFLWVLVFAIVSGVLLFADHCHETAAPSGEVVTEDVTR